MSRARYTIPHAPPTPRPRRGARLLTLLALVGLASACGPQDDGGGTGSLSLGMTDTGTQDDTGPGTDGAIDSDSESATGSAGPSSDGSTGGASTSDGSAGPGGADTSDGATSDVTAGATTGGGAMQACGGKIYACNDGEDNDGDGLVDAADPECVGPCDDDEATFATGLPGDNVDCKQDCFFDGNSGQGDDGCNWDLRCDPENPGEGLGCEYKDGPQCKDGAHDADDACIAACAGNTPNGCDCFGCCTVQTEDGPVDIFLNSPGCSLDNLDACNSCTPSEDCNNPCDPDDCELCFGETELPQDCDGANCDGAPACTVDEEGQSDCPEGMFCLVGCCYEFSIPE